MVQNKKLLRILPLLPEQCKIWWFCWLSFFPSFLPSFFLFLIVLSHLRFPWESAFSGVETCPTFAATGLREDHISGDIAFAIWQYYKMTGDVEWLTTIGYPMLVGIAGKNVLYFVYVRCS
jgi:hypothetical protein